MISGEAKPDLQVVIMILNCSTLFIIYIRMFYIYVFNESCKHSLNMKEV